MAERASIFQTVQIGLETVEGTEVDAGKKLQAMTVEISPMLEVETYKPTGGKFATVAALNKEWTEATLGGPITYTEIVYPLSSVLGSATVTGTATPVTWTFNPGQSSASVVRSYTIEQGSTERAHLFTGAIVQTLNFEFTRDGCELSGTMIGRALSDGITMTSTPAAIDLIPVMPTQVVVRVDPGGTAALGTAVALTRALSASWGVSDRYSPIWALTGSASYPVTVETDPGLEFKLKVEADSTGMAQLPYMRVGSTVWTRITATGPALSSGTASMTITTPVKWTDVTSFADSDGVFAIEYTGTGVYDSTWTKATEVVVVNNITAL